MIRTLSLSLLLAFSSMVATATPVVYQFVIDTSSLSGNGFLDIQFNRSSVLTEPATASFSNFTMGSGSLGGAPVNTVGVGSDLPGLVISLTEDLNQTLQPVIWGNQISFLVTLAGTLLENSDPNAADGAQFSVSLLNATQTDFLLGGGPLAGVDIFPGGFGGGTFPFNNGAPGIVSISEVPEPATFLMIGAGLVALGVTRRRR
jgi:hypothetical protein